MQVYTDNAIITNKKFTQFYTGILLIVNEPFLLIFFFLTLNYFY